ncbi:DrmB family protein [Streptomyces sp. NPDC127197]|uniref:DrmB family protein n=1 Tax=Streptomyces sp. NPDC127197 TaxID=3345388 RepID=UPI003625AD78
MTPPPPRRRRRTDGDSAVPRLAFPRRGSVRRSQMITTYGVGSLIAVDNESFIVSGIDDAHRSWSLDEAPIIHEHRLARVLGVNHFRLPPASEDTSKDGVRVRRFPLWHSCPKCQSLQHVRSFNPPPGKNVCTECDDEPLVPSRFVMACEDGHLDDFPYWKWLHRKNREEGTTGHCGGQMSMRFSGQSASLRSVLVSCTCGVPEVSMEGAFRRSALTDLGVRCEGRRPWLRDAPAEFCTQAPRTLQRGSSAVWQPVLKSALSIPPWSDGLADKLSEHWENLRSYSSRTEIEIYLKGAFRGDDSISVDAVMELLAAEQEEDPAQESDSDAGAVSRYQALRRQEYERLCSGNALRDKGREEQFICEPPTSDPAVLDPFGVGRPMLVKRLREVRALKAFTRIADPESSSEGHEAALSLTPTDWLPAMEVHGEGVFVRLDENRLDDWAESVAVAARVERMRTNHDRMLRERATDPAEVPSSPATPRMVLLHTLAHVLINEWSLDAGYPAAALRERLYTDATMAGFLIYTATSDSAGSLGGVVAQGEPDRLAEALRSALRRATWCSADPLCIEARSSGTGGANLAACHACAMLPETSCEHNNILLDRALLVGTPDDPHLGFFADILEQ